MFCQIIGSPQAPTETAEALCAIVGGPNNEPTNTTAALCAIVGSPSNTTTTTATFNPATAFPSILSATPIDTTPGLHPVTAHLDLGRISRRVAKENPTWSTDRLHLALAEYRKFMTLASKGLCLAPCQDVDEIWHAHILHTMDYSLFCKALMGQDGFMHHQPLDEAMATEEDREGNMEAFERTMSEYEGVFGKPPGMWGLGADGGACTIWCAFDPAPVEAEAEAEVKQCYAVPSTSKDGSEVIARPERAKVNNKNAAGCVPCLGLPNNNNDNVNSNKSALCFAAPNKYAKAAGCVPCFGFTERGTGKKIGANKFEKAAGCVPCFGFTERGTGENKKIGTNKPAKAA